MSNENESTEEKIDPDWMYKPILNGAFSGRSKTEKDVIGTPDGMDCTPQ